MKKTLIYLGFFSFVFAAGMMVGTADYGPVPVNVSPQMATMGVPGAVRAVPIRAEGKPGQTVIIRIK